MPKIPIDQQQISLNVRDAGNVPYAHEFGQLGTAIAGVGQDIEQGSLTILQQVNHAAAVDAAANKFAEMKMWANQTQTQLKLQSPDGMMHEDPTDPNSPIVKNDDNTPRTIAREFYDQANAKYRDGQDSMPSELASQMFRERALPHLSEQGALLQNEGLQMRIKYGDQQQMLRAKQLGGDLYNTPVMSPRVDPATGNPVMGKDAQGNSTGKPEMLINGNEYYDNVKNELQNINDKVGVNYNQEGAQERITQVKHTMTEEAGRNMLNQLQIEKRLGKNGEPLDGTTKIQDIAANVAFLKGEDPQSKARKAAGLPTFSDDMDPDKRDILIGKMLAMVPQAKQTDDANYHHLFENEIGALKVRMSHPDVFNEVLRQTAERGLMDPTKHGLEAASNIGELFGAKEIGITFSDGFYNLKPEAQIAQMKAGMHRAQQGASDYAQSLGFNYTSDMAGKALESIQSAFDARYRMIRDATSHDSVGFMTTARPELRGATPIGDIGKKMSQLYSGDLTMLGNKQDRRTYQQFAQAAKNSGAYDGRQLSLGDSKLIGSQLQDISAGGYNEIQKGKIVSNLQSLWGPDYGKNVQQLINDGNLPPKYAIMGLHTSDDPLSQQYLMSQLSKPKTVVENDKLNSGGATEADVKQAVSAQAASYVRSATKHDPDNNSIAQMKSQVEEVIENGTWQELANKTATNPTDAAKLAYNKMVGKVTVSADNKNHYAEDNRVKDFILPRNFQGIQLGPAQLSVIHSNLNYTAKHLDTFEPNVPPPPAGTSPEMGAKFSEQYLTNLKRNAYPVRVTSPSEGANFDYVDSTGTVQHVLSNDGKTKLFVPLETLMKPRPGIEGTWHSIKRFFGNED